MTLPKPDRLLALALALAACALLLGGAPGARAALELPLTVSANCSGLPSAFATDCTKAYAECAVAPAAERSLCSTDLTAAFDGLRTALNACNSVPAAEKTVCQQALQKELAAIKPEVGTSTTSTATTSTSTSSTATTSTSTTPSTPPPPPVSGVSADVTPVSGTVLVNGKPLVAGEQIPVGATVDTTNGKVTLESVSPTGVVQSAQFYDGEFTLQQPKHGITGLVLKGGNFAVCSTKGTRRLAAAPANTTVVRSLWGSGHGQFLTQGKYAAATVRGTVWETLDRCDGTEIYAKSGVVSVTDLVTKKSLTLTTGQTFLAKS